MRHLVVIIAVILAVIGDGWAQNRGSARYVPPEDFDEDITRAPRVVPTRGAAGRRQRPTKAPEPAPNDEPKAYQPPEVPSRTTGRRVPQRVSPQHVVPPPPSPPLPVEEAVPRYLVPAEEPQVPLAQPEGKPQNTRRRRPKKRRRPQNALPKEGEEPEKQIAPARVDGGTSILDLVNEDKKRSDIFPNSPVSRNNPSYISDPSYQPEKASFETNSSPEQQNNAAGPQYFRPQPPTNRLPVGDAEPIGNSGGYIDSPINSANDGPAPFVPERPVASVPNDASYVPVLSPIRVPARGASRLPPESYSSIQSPSRPTLLSDPNAPVREHGQRPPLVDPEEVIRDTSAKPVHNIIPQSDEPVRSHSEVRLPENEQPVLSEYVPPSFDSNEDQLISNPKASGENKEPASPTNRLPNPSEIHYDSVYPEYTDYSSSQRRRQEPEEPSIRNPLPSYSTPRRDSGTKPQEYDNDAEVDRRQASEYRPPLQRTVFRHSPENSERPTRSRTQEQSPTTTAPRTRGSSRYQTSEPDYIPERTRGSTRTRSDGPSDSPSRSRSSVTPQSSTRTRGSQRYAPDTMESAHSRSREQPGARTETELQDYGSVRSTLRHSSGSRSPDTMESAPRTSPRRQTANTEEIRRDTPSAEYIPVDELIENPQPSSHSSRSREQPGARTETELQDYGSVRSTLRHSSGSREQPGARTETELQDHGSVRNTLRSRPQYEVREESYEESVDDENTYNSDYQVPRQTNTRGRTSQRPPVPVQQPPQPEYQVPPNRQQSRPHYEPPQNPRSRHQPQYQAPQNPRVNSRQIANRENTVSSRPQGRARHQNSEPSPAPRRSSGGSNFACPDAFGFYADPVQCDKYYECRNGTAEMHLCNDGLAFNEVSAPKFLRCDSLRDVDCKSRSELQEAQPTKNCPRKFGLFPHETDCTKFWNCVDGVSSEVQCPPGLTYNNERATCDWADLVKSSCKTEDLLGFTCPEPTAHDLLDGVYSRYPHPDNCQLHFTCIKGADGLRRPRMLSCNEGLVFDSATSSCKRPEEVPGCEDFYGVRSPAPKRKPARQPEPEPEEIEEPTPRPRRRGSNRRNRN